MKSLSIVRNCLQRYVARSKKGGFSMKVPRTLLTMFVLTFGAAILLAGVWVQLSASAAPGGGPKGPKGGKNKPHEVQLSGDITSAPMVFDLNPDNPLGKLDLDGFEVTFPVNTSGAGCCISDCDQFIDGWGDYAAAENDSWTGTLSLQKTKQGGSKKWRFGYLATNLSGGSINLSVQQTEPPVDVTNGSETLFFDARGLVSAGSSPGIVDTEDPAKNNRCLTFTITATLIP